MHEEVRDGRLSDWQDGRVMLVSLAETVVSGEAVCVGHGVMHEEKRKSSRH